MERRAVFGSVLTLLALAAGGCGGSKTPSRREPQGRRAPPRTAMRRHPPALGRRSRRGRAPPRSRRNTDSHGFSASVGSAAAASGPLLSVFRGHDRRRRYSDSPQFPTDDAQACRRVSSGRRPSAWPRPSGPRRAKAMLSFALPACARTVCRASPIRTARDSSPSAASASSTPLRRSSRVPSSLVSRWSRRSGRESRSGSNDRARSLVPASHARAGGWSCRTRPRRCGMRGREGIVGRQPRNDLDVIEQRREQCRRCGTGERSRRELCSGNKQQRRRPWRGDGDEPRSASSS